jgi:DNA polymerase-4
LEADINKEGTPRRIARGPTGPTRRNYQCLWNTSVRSSTLQRGIDDREVRANRIRKSVGAENTFANDLTEFKVMLPELQPLIDKVWWHCEGKGARGRTVTLKVKFADFELISRSRTLVGAIGSRDELECASAELLKALFPLEKAVRLLGVAISGFSIVAIGRSEQITFAL